MFIKREIERRRSWMNKFEFEAIPQTKKEQKASYEAFNSYIDFLFSHTDMCGYFTCSNFNAKKLFRLSKRECQRLTNVPYPHPLNWIAAQHKSMRISSVPKRLKLLPNGKRDEVKSGFIQVVIPCQGEGYHLEELVNLIYDGTKIPAPTYYIQRADGFDIVYLLKKSIAPTMGLSFRALTWTLANEIVKLEREINEVDPDKNFRKRKYELSFHVQTEKIGTSQNLCLPGSYHKNHMVKALFHPFDVQYTYHELLDAIGCKRFNGKYQIENMKASIERIRGVRIATHLYIPNLFEKEPIYVGSHKDAKIQLDRIHNLENLLLDGYDKETGMHYYQQFLCQLFSNYYENLKVVAKEIVGRIQAFCHKIQYFISTDSCYQYVEDFERVKSFSNNCLMECMGFEDYQWNGKTYFGRTKHKKNLAEKIKEQMVEIASMMKQGLSNAEMMLRTGLNKDRFFERKRRIQAAGGYLMVAEKGWRFEQKEADEFDGYDEKEKAILQGLKKLKEEFDAYGYKEPKAIQISMNLKNIQEEFKNLFDYIKRGGKFVMERKMSVKRELTNMTDECYNFLDQKEKEEEEIVYKSEAERAEYFEHFEQFAGRKSQAKIEEDPSEAEDVYEVLKEFDAKDDELDTPPWLMPAEEVFSF